jgi:hypothetical protein
MQVSNGSGTNFQRFFDRQTTTNILHKFIRLSAQYSNIFQLSNGVLNIHNSYVKWSCYIQRGFNSESIREATKFAGTYEYDVFCRLISYNTPIYSTRQPMIDVFRSNVLFTPRQLYGLELQLFNIQPVSNQQAKFVKSFDEFMNNFNSLFFLNWYVYSKKSRYMREFG